MLKLFAGKGYADYAGKTPSFHSFGALVMLVPALEVMQMGFNVIYFDVDMGLVQNPVPYMVTGDADFVTTLGEYSTHSQLCVNKMNIGTLEIRRCPEFYPSADPQKFTWETIEPNTGVMHLRATTQGIAFFRAWLERIVHNNALNDQKVPKITFIAYSTAKVIFSMKDVGQEGAGCYLHC